MDIKKSNSAKYEINMKKTVQITQKWIQKSQVLGARYVKSLEKGIENEKMRTENVRMGTEKSNI